MRKPTTKEVARFFDKVKVTKHCWLWKGGLSCGYGVFWFQGKDVKAHRFSYNLFVGLIQPGKQILHRRECGNTNCVNPHHLYMGTPADNHRDRVLWGSFIFGEAHKNAKLTKEDVLDIRSLRKNKGFTYKLIGDMFGVGAAQIYRIVKKQNWKQLPETGNLSNAR